MFVRKAKAYRSKGSGGYESSEGRTRSKSIGKVRPPRKEHYQLDDLNENTRSAFPPSNAPTFKSESEELILLRSETCKGSAGIQVMEEGEVGRPRTRGEGDGWRSTNSR